MGLFLQAAIMPGCGETEARAAVAAAAEKYSCAFDALEGEDLAEEGIIISELIPDECQYAETQEGVSILFNDGCIGYDSLAKVLSRESGKVCLLLYIYDGDYWGYELYDHGEAVDQFNPMPDYFEDVSGEKMQKSKGDVEVVAAYFHVEKASIEKYLVRWSEETMDGKAYEDDEFGYEDWQMADFMRKLGYPYNFDEQ